MKKRLILFGIGAAAEVAHYYFTHDSSYEIVCFTVDAEYIKEDTFCGLPVVPFVKIQELYPPHENSFFVAMGYNKLNTARKEKYNAARNLGYTLASYISSRANVMTDRIGDNCFLLEDNTIQPFTIIGNNVTLWSGNHIGHHSIIEDHVFIASHVVVSGHVTIGEQTFIGVNATLRDGICIGARCVIGAGALLLANAEPEGVYLGTASERSKVPSTRLRSI
ncbi:transferase [Verrucomicrobia bacterium LW23]|nr:transferase [Verrucomicrobia bacterium LW23]